MLSIDFETRSWIDLKFSGVYPYAQHHSTSVLCMAWAFDDDEPSIWLPGMPLENQIVKHITAGAAVHAWNAQFERVMWQLCCRRLYGWPMLHRDQVYDTAADAAALALPRSLSGAARALGLDVEKDAEGHRVAMQLCKPRRPTKNDPRVWWDEPEKYDKLYAYCRQDVIVERAVGKRIKPLSAHERKVYLLDQKINDRGVRIDVPLVRAAQSVMETATEHGNAQLSEITGGDVETVTRVAQLKMWLAHRDLDIENLRKETIRDVLNDDGIDLDPLVREALTIRTETAKSSTAKLTSMTRVICSDLRARGLLLYHAAGTGRWGGKLIQPQNFPRGTVRSVADFIPRVLAGEYDLIELDAPPAAVVSSMLRSMLIASKGSRLIAGDYSQIEARIVGWIAGQDDLCDLFASGGRIYEEMGAYIFGMSVEDVLPGSFERQVGKNTVLGCGFQMGPDRFAEQAQEQTGLIIPRGDRDEEGDLLPGQVDMAAKAVDGYRELYHKVPDFWRAINDAAIAAVRSKGQVFYCGRNDLIAFTFRGQFLWCRLPSGRCLAYALPAMQRTKMRWKDAKGNDVYRESLTHMGVDSKTKKWKRETTYGGKLTENVVQAMARDLMAAAMLRLEDAGYPIVLTVHDEVVADVPNERGSVAEFISLMMVLPRWAEGLPVAAEGWDGERYRK